MSAFVLDASVAAKWVLPPGNETLNAEAHDLLERFAAGEIALVIPDLFWAEMGNILWKAAVSKRITSAAAVESITWIQSLKLRVMPTADLAHDSMSIALGYNRSFYDSLYLALAVRNGIMLLTADERLANAVGHRLPVRWLGSAHPIS